MNIRANLIVEKSVIPHHLVRGAQRNLELIPHGSLTSFGSGHFGNLLVGYVVFTYPQDPPDVSTPCTGSNARTR